MVNPAIADELVEYDQYQYHQSYKYQRPFKRSIHAGESNGVVKVIGWEELESKLLRLNLDVLKLAEQCQARQDLIGHIGIELAFG